MTNCRTCKSDSYQGDRCGLCGRTACVDCAEFSNADLLDFKHLEKYRNDRCAKEAERIRQRTRKSYLND